MATNDFDKVAPYYETLASLVFRNSLKKAQLVNIHQIREGSSVLVLGGGTGWIINNLLDAQSDIQITYLEKSKKMLRLSKSKISTESENKVDFLYGEFETWRSDKTYDYIICNFFLDVFKPEKLNGTIVPKLIDILKPDGKLMVSDFELTDNKRVFFHRLLLLVIHRFFKITANLESNQLSDINGELISQKFVIEEESMFRRGSIFSRIYSMVD